MLIEAVFLLVLVMLPLFYLVGTLGRLQAGAYAVSAAAREAGRTFVASPDEASGQAAATTAAWLVMDAHGFGSDDGGVALVCTADPCLTPGSTVRINATLQVALPLIPDFMSGVVPTSVTLTSSHVSPVEAYREQ
ncbi:pilus assembly protein [Ornithinimicrobium sp. F0845]|uniref:pilus assembly protein n=1 Tax=Ornithinimicrobium sp. F0845 TaxID=2926412 RepID=UPI001FF5A913|nr:pilus assembly protein [Ornithinimicrobium sp. F0845]MCK0111439.1 pilus assembly protein [Ornithinimicrobium sp. F0845]